LAVLSAERAAEILALLEKESGGLKRYRQTRVLREKTLSGQEIYGGCPTGITVIRVAILKIVKVTRSHTRISRILYLSCEVLSWGTEPHTVPQNVLNSQASAIAIAEVGRAIYSGLGSKKVSYSRKKTVP